MSFANPFNPAAPALSEPQQVALRVFVSGGSAEDARAQANVEPGQITAWLRDPEFLAALHQARLDLWQERLGQIQQAAGKAVDTLMDIMQNSNDVRARLHAARILIQFSHKAMREEQERHAKAEDAAALRRCLQPLFRPASAPPPDPAETHSANRGQNRTFPDMTAPPPLDEEGHPWAGNSGPIPHRVEPETPDISGQQAPTTGR